jgi:hypothetical protein
MEPLYIISQFTWERPLDTFSARLALFFVSLRFILA